MNKSELIQAIATKTNVSKADVHKVIDALTDTVSEQLANGGDIVLVGFGTFSVKQREARTGRNPQTGEAIQIAAAKVPTFKAGKGLKDAVNG